MFTATENPNGDINVIFNGAQIRSNFTSTATTSVEVEAEGEIMRILYFHLNGTIYDRFISWDHRDRDTSVGLRPFHTIDNHPMAENTDEWVEGVDFEFDSTRIAAVYYVAGDYSEMWVAANNSPAAFMEQAYDAGATLVWQRPGVNLNNAIPINTNS